MLFSCYVYEEGQRRERKWKGRSTITCCSVHMFPCSTSEQLYFLFLVSLLFPVCLCVSTWIVTRVTGFLLLCHFIVLFIAHWFLYVSPWLWVQRGHHQSTLFTYHLRLDMLFVSTGLPLYRHVWSPVSVSMCVCVCVLTVVSTLSIINSLRRVRNNQFYFIDHHDVIVSHGCAVTWEMTN